MDIEREHDMKITEKHLCAIQDMKECGSISERLENRKKGGEGWYHLVELDEPSRRFNTISEKSKDKEYLKTLVPDGYDLVPYDSLNCRRLRLIKRDMRKKNERKKRV